MTSSKSVRTATPVRAHAIAGVGRLVPVEGITVRPHPDRDTLLQFLHEVQLPLAAIDNFVELAELQALPPGGREALAAIAANARDLGDLVGDYREFAWLEADQVVASPVVTAPVRWLEGVVAGSAVRAARHGCPVQVVHRSFLPDAVWLAGDLAEQAVATVLRTAMRRALPGPVELRVSYDCAFGGEAAGRLCLAVVTRGGGFTEIEQGYAFAPFVALDRHERPLLGLSVARRLCQLLGGELAIGSTGPSAGCYTMTLPAPAAPGAAWVDPLAVGCPRLGRIYPGRVLFVEAGNDHQLLCSAVLRRAGHLVEGATSVPEALQQLAGPAADQTAIVVDAQLPGLALGAFVEGLRAAGHCGRVILLTDQNAPAWMPPAIGAVLHKPLAGEALLAVLEERAAGGALTLRR